MLEQMCLLDMQPLEVREARPDKARKVDKLGVFAEDKKEADFLILNVGAIEAGRSVVWFAIVGVGSKLGATVDCQIGTVSGMVCRRVACRDIGGSDPERMAAPRVAEYVTDLFKDTTIKV